MIDQNGVPSVVQAGATMGDEEVAELRKVETPPVSFAELVETFLAQASNAVEAVIDPINRKVYLTDDVGEFMVPFAAACGTQVPLTLAPETGQEGRSLTWEETAKAGGFDADYAAAIEASIAAAKPRRSLGSMIAATISAIPLDANGNPTVQPLIVVNQEDGNVQVLTVQNRAAGVAALDAVDPAGKGARVTLAADPDSSGTTPLVFEGGATS